MSSGHSYGSQGLDAGSVLHYLARVLCTWVFLVGEELRQSQRKPQSALQMGEGLYPVLLSFPPCLQCPLACSYQVQGWPRSLGFSCSSDLAGEAERPLILTEVS